MFMESGVEIYGNELLGCYFCACPIQSLSHEYMYIYDPMKTYIWINVNCKAFKKSFSSSSRQMPRG